MNRGWDYNPKKKNSSTINHSLDPKAAESLELELLRRRPRGQQRRRLGILATHGLPRRVGRARVVAVEVDVLVWRPILTTCGFLWWCFFGGKKKLGFYGSRNRIEKGFWVGKKLGFVDVELMMVLFWWKNWDLWTYEWDLWLMSNRSCKVGL